MQENNIIYEITQKIQDKEIVENDMKEAFLLVTDLFKKKYINKLESEVKNRLDFIKKNPPKEITLLNAIKPFLNENSHENIDNAITILTNFSAINFIKDNLAKENNNQLNTISINSLEERDPSVKEDGVYDFSENCFFSINNNHNKSSIIYIFAILLLFSSYR